MEYRLGSSYNVVEHAVPLTADERAPMAICGQKVDIVFTRPNAEPTCQKCRRKLGLSNNIKARKTAKERP